jgi:hypothetical protein
MMTSSARQQDNEPLAEHYKRFTSYVDVGESQWGTPVPTAAATNETNEKMSRDKFITCVFCTSTDLFLASALAMAFFSPCSAILTQSYGKSIQQFWLILA